MVIFLKFDGYIVILVSEILGVVVSHPTPNAIELSKLAMLLTIKTDENTLLRGLCIIFRPINAELWK